MSHESTQTGSGWASGRVLSVGTRLAERYRIERFIASGGMGEVYEATDEALGERVALKVLTSPSSALEEEVRLARRVTHVNVCRVFDLGVHSLDGVELRFLTMELIRGEPLSAVLRRRGRIPASEVKKLICGVCEALAAAWEAKWELSVPLIVVGLFSSGYATMVEAAAVAFCYAIVVECFILRDIHPIRDLPKVLLDAGVLCGSVLILLSSALGLTSWLVDAQIPDALLSMVKTHIHSPYLFLLVLNVVLLILGSVLEIYSAIIILAPLVAPIGAAFGIDPLHLGVVFLANLELGFLFPPAGLNLFLASSRFQKPLPQLYRHVVPFLLILGAGVLAITYFPQMSTGIVRLLGK